MVADCGKEPKGDEFIYVGKLCLMMVDFLGGLTTCLSFPGSREEYMMEKKWTKRNETKK